MRKNTFRKKYANPVNAAQRVINKGKFSALGVMFILFEAIALACEKLELEMDITHDEALKRFKQLFDASEAEAIELFSNNETLAETYLLASSHVQFVFEVGDGEAAQLLGEMCCTELPTMFRIDDEIVKCADYRRAHPEARQHSTAAILEQVKLR